jgi:hypothetical protein
LGDGCVVVASVPHVTHNVPPGRGGR